MKAPWHILYLDDSPREAALVRDELTQSELEIRLRSVTHRAEFEAALVEARFDLILSDFNLPDYDGMAAFAKARERQPQAPFILISGALGEERVVECLRAGVTDCVLKQHLERLPSVVNRALTEAHELHKRREAEAALRDSEERLREQAEMLNQAHDSIILTDMQHRITYWNRGAAQLYGWTAKEAIGNTFEDLFTAEDLANLDAIRQKTLAKGFWSGEWRLHDQQGRELLVKATRTLIRAADGTPKGVISISEDITDRKKLETQLLRAQRMESIGTLAGGIAHDLNNVLGPILLSLPLLRQGLAEPRDLELLDLIETTAQRGAGIVRQVLTFARGLDGERSPVQVRHLLTETEKLLRETFPKDIRLNFDAPRDIWLVHADATQIQQVLMNLCVNARDAMGDDGLLTVEAENFVIDEDHAAMHVEARPGPYVVIRVTDTGSGIPENIREQIFDPFFTTKEMGRGTGLGLSTTLRIVKSHRGFINVYTEEGVGTTFKVYLPAEAVCAEKILASQSRELPGGRGETILLVDDEPAILHVVARSLERHGYKVLTARDGAEALGVYVQNASQIAVVLTDMTMPVLDGAATARALLTINPRVKIILSSGLATNGAVVKALQGGVKHSLTKPYTIEAVLKMVRLLIDKPT